MFVRELVVIMTLCTVLIMLHINTPVQFYISIFLNLYIQVHLFSQVFKKNYCLLLVKNLLVKSDIISHLWV